MAAVLTPWSSAEEPGEDRLEALLREEGLSSRWWSNGPGHTYGAHSHGYRKVLYCARGSIRFDVGTGESFDLRPGDRLDIPAGTSHSAVVGPAGVKCVEAAKGGR